MYKIKYSKIETIFYFYYIKNKSNPQRLTKNLVPKGMTSAKISTIRWDFIARRRFETPLKKSIISPMLLSLLVQK